MKTKKEIESPCPSCGSRDIMGLVAAFWAAITPEGDPEKPLNELVCSETEIGAERMCCDCGTEWDAGDQEESK